MSERLYTDFTPIHPEGWSGVRLSVFLVTEATRPTESLSVFEQVRCWCRSPNVIPQGGPKACLPPVELAPKCRLDATRARTQAPGHRPVQDTQPESWWHLPWGSSSFRRLSAWAVVAPGCLPGTIRSQGFSPSQRFNPARALRLCFAPHPPIGFLAFRAFPTQPAVTPLGAPCSFVVTASSGLVGLPHPPHCPSLSSTTGLAFQRCRVPRGICASRRASQHHRFVGWPKPWPQNESGSSARRVDAQRLIAQFSGVTPVKWNNFRLAWDANFRALLQLSVRTRAVRR